MRTTKLKFPGRYTRENLWRLLAGLWAAGREAAQKTDAERKTALLKWSLENDFKDGFRVRPHGQDAYSTAQKALPFLEAQTAREKLEQEAAYLRAALQHVEDFQRAAQVRLEEIETGAGRMPAAFLERRRIIEEAKRRVAE